MKTQNPNSKIRKVQIILFSMFLIASFFSLVSSVNAQFQENDFSGNDPSSYQCLNAGGTLDPSLAPFRDSSGIIRCPSGGQAVLKPPKLQQLEVWFIRIIYAIWALVASLSFLFLVKLGFDYMISRGDVTQITAIRKRIINYAIGVALVFLSIPILTTIFNLLSINDDVNCYDEIAMPGFQFFFTNTCTASSSLVVANCGNGFATSRACTNENEVIDCPSITGAGLIWECIGSTWTVIGP